MLARPKTTAPRGRRSPDRDRPPPLLHWGAGHGKLKLYVLDEMRPRKSVFDTDPSTERYPTLPAGADKGSNALPSSASKWVAKYRVKQMEWAAERTAATERHAAVAAARQQTLRDMASNRAFAGAIDHHHRISYDPKRPIKEQARPREVWNPGWGVNNVCEVTGLPVQSGNSRRCRYCPVVVHISAAAGKARIQESLVGHEEPFVCPDCEREVSMSVDELTCERQRQHDLRLAASAAVRLQKGIRARAQRMAYNCFKGGARLLQAQQRGILARHRLRESYGQMVRPFRMKILHASELHAADATGSSDPYVLFEVVKGANEDMPLFRFESKVKQQTLEPVWHETFLVPGMNGAHTLVITVIDHDSTRHDFLGQAVVRLKDTDIWAKGGHFDVPLENMVVRPKERNRTAMRLGNASFPGAGSISFELKPVAHQFSVCGLLEQKDELCLHHGEQAASGGKKRWSVLADGVLRIYGVHGDTKAKTTISLKRSPKVEVHPYAGGKPWQKLIAIMNPDMKSETFVFLPNSKSQTKEWCHKVQVVAGTEVKELKLSRRKEGGYRSSVGHIRDSVLELAQKGETPRLDPDADATKASTGTGIGVAGPTHST